MGKLVVLLFSVQLVLSSLFADERKPSNVNNKDFSNQTALHDAVRTKKLDMVKFLVESKTKIDTKDQFGYTPLHLAVRYSDLNTTNFLIENKADINSIDSYGETPLIDAVRSDDTEISKALICAKANREVEDQYNVTPVHYATKNQNLYLLKLLTVDYVELYCQDKIEISIDEVDPKENDNISKICGKLDVGYASFMSLVLVGDDQTEYGPYKVDVDNEKHTWCSTVDDELPKGKYRLTAKANDYVVNYATAKADRFVSSAIKIEIDKTQNPIYSLSPSICGTIKNAYAKKVELSVSPENNESIVYGPYNATVQNEEKTWCADVNATLEEGSYKFSALGEDEKGNISKDSMISEIKTSILIDIDPIPVYNDITPKICGRVLRGDVLKLDITMTNKDGITTSPYEAKINQKDQTWCADVTDELENGEYVIDATGYDKDENKAMDSEKTKIYRIVGLYEALKEEFKDDFEPWSAELDKDTLTFRFKDPTLLFNTGSSNINEKFKAILDDFFPRYVRIVEEYRVEIEKVRIEGHSSSEHSRATSDAERFELNRQLSQKRAESVMNNAKIIDNEILKTNEEWVATTFEAIGMSYSKLIYNLDGSENKELSRRVEFRIVTKAFSDTAMIDGEVPTPDAAAGITQ